VFTVVSANVNGIRAAARRGGLAWLTQCDADVICLQEVRADNDQLRKALADEGLGHYDVAAAAAETAGRAGVAILSRTTLSAVECGVDEDEFAGCGRWVQARVITPVGPLTIASVYVHTGEANTDRQVQKYRFLDAMSRRLTELRPPTDSDSNAIVCGDLNVARSEADIKNWRGNLGKSGFLPQEQRYLDRWSDDGWTDLGRAHAGEVAGPYTWWSWRGKAFDNDAGWRIDYVWATDGLSSQLDGFTVGRAETYAERWSDHAPVTAKFTRR
jgi:exodeoxyribonuclease III